jgi:hypothetical protein
MKLIGGYIGSKTWSIWGIASRRATASFGATVPYPFRRQVNLDTHPGMPFSICDLDPINLANNGLRPVSKVQGLLQSLTFFLKTRLLGGVKRP